MPVPAEKEETFSPSVGNQDGHEITNVTIPNELPVSSATSFASCNPSSPLSVSIQHEQRIEDQIAKLEETKKFANSLEEIFKIAPTIALLRALDINEGSPESRQLFQLNQGYDFNNKLILNDGTIPIRIAIPVPGNPDEYTSVVPSIIPVGIKTSIPDLRTKGQWIQMEAPRREPNIGENEKVRALIQKAIVCYYGEAAMQEKLPKAQSHANITVLDVSNMIQGISEMMSEVKNYCCVAPDDQKFLQEADQVIHSTYALLFKGVAAAAEFAVRSAGVLANTSVETVKSAAAGAVEGVSSVIEYGILPLASIISLAGIQVTNNNVSIVMGMAATHMMFITLIFAGFAAIGSGLRTFFTLPVAIKSSIEYFAPQQALEKSIAAFSNFERGRTVLSNFEYHAKIFEALKNANEADKNLKQTITEAFTPFIHNKECQQIHTMLTAQIDQRIIQYTKLMEAFHKKIKEIKTTGPLSRKQNFRIALKNRR